MIDLYTYGTSNGQRVSVMLEECALPYRPHKVDLATGEQRGEEFHKLNPSGQIPVIVDHLGPHERQIVIAQSGAILFYLAEKSGRFLPTDPAQRAHVMEAFMQVMSDVAPTSAAIFYTHRAGGTAEAKAMWRDRFLDMLTHLDRRLARHEWLGGESLSIADIALYPSIAGRQAILEEAPGLTSLSRWATTMALRPAVSRGMGVPG
ncbi:glutathione S-transferase family protein [Geminicoccaceae bacterium 1502E]|nr:glutathione S-transferase family protein [Geminicoccaceae bacterium 1502E]